MFDTTKDDLKDILRNVDKGSLQLPDFQRSYVWNDADVCSLIASIAKGFPVGALLTLETGGEVSFKPRLLEGVGASDSTPNELLLDGQQRMTSIYQATFSGNPVRTRTAQKKLVDRLYYLDIEKACVAGADIEDAIISVPADGIIRENFGRDIKLDLSSQEREFEQNMFPLNQVFDSRDWIFDWRDYCRNQGRDIQELERDFSRGVVDTIERYKMPVIRLDRKNSREAICTVFEKVNVGGKKLDAFELVTAIYAGEEFDLRADWYGSADTSCIGIRDRMVGTTHPRDVLTRITSKEFLQACTLLHTRQRRLDRYAEGARGKELPQVSCQRQALLALPLDSYRQFADYVEKGFVEAASFLNELKIIWHKDIPYPPHLVGLAATFAILGRQANTVAARKKLECWFWSVTLGELYGSATESQIARDVPEVVDWIRGEAPEPRVLELAVFQKPRFKSLRGRQSAAYKGISALLMRKGCRDFITGKSTDVMTYFNDDIDIHHIFPKAWCNKHRIDLRVYDAIVNKTPLSKLSNISVGGDAPSVYLKRIEHDHGIASEDLDDILRSHLIEPEHLRNDDFEAFYDARCQALVGLVGGAMDKPVVDDPGGDEVDLNDDESDREEEVLA